MNASSHTSMPPLDPLAHPVQDLRSDYRDALAPRTELRSRATLWRIATFLPAFVTTALLLIAFTDWLSMDGLSTLEITLISLVALTFFWISLAVSTATIGAVQLISSRRKTPVANRTPSQAMSVALLIPAYNEVTWDVFGNAIAMIDALHASQTDHTFDLFILSDTQDTHLAEQEQMAYAALKAALPSGMNAYYRRRVENTDRKTGNLADWVKNWGGAYEAMIVLDADSLMSDDALIELTDALASDPSAGLIQSSPRLIGAETFFGRVQQFSGVVYGALMAEGLAKWSDSEGNYWGHNAIIRTKAFASCAGLPRMPSLTGRGNLIMSHDFVEAGLLRRAGWSVRFLPRIPGSYEEPPATLVDYAIRDRRWCHGNLQHLAIVPSTGFHSVSRFHLFHGAFSYLLSPIWFVLLMIWALLGNGEQSVIRYFSETSPLYPIWPEMSQTSSLLILLFMYGMLLAPKIMGAAAISLTGMTPAHLGGMRQFLTSLITEIVASILFAPIMMVQQLIAVLRTTFGLKVTWNPQPRSGGKYSVTTLLKFHALETVSGALLVLGMFAGLVSLWLLPIAISLAGSVAISALSSINLSRWTVTRNQLGTPEMFNEPKIVSMAKARRKKVRSMIENHLPAE